MLRRIKPSELNDLAREFHFRIDESQVGEYETLTEFMLGTLDSLDAVRAPERAVVAAVRDPGRRPTREEDPYNAIVRWCHVKADIDGPLSGKRIGLKDAIAIAGVPMTCGSRVMQGFVPTVDSIVTERLLGAGATITAITNMDNLAFSGGGDTSAYASTLCPFDLTRTAGGSSGGSAAGLFYEDIDITLGADQGGSIRAPAAWCGVLGLKPTHGLVPYVGIAGIDQTFDHCGPLALGAEDAALVMQVIAGADEGDPRQRGGVKTDDYVRLVIEAGDNLRGLRVGVLDEAFGAAVGIEAETASAAMEAIERIGRMGAEVRKVSVPAHLQGGGIAFAGFVEGMTALVRGGGNGWHWKGRYWPELAAGLREGLTNFGDDLPPQVKLTLVCGAHLQRHYSGGVYARAQNLRPWLTAAYDRVLRDVDVLVMPTTPGRAHVDDPTLPIAEHVTRGWAVLANTAPFDMTGHPALSIPAAESAGLPVGLMLVGRHFDDGRLLAIARSYEKTFGWLPAHPGRARPPIDRASPVSRRAVVPPVQ
jgi:amidase